MNGLIMNCELQNKIPQVRFPEFKEDWEVKKFDEIGNRITKKNTDFAVKLVLTNSATKGIISQTDFFDKKIANNVNLNNYYIADVDDFVYNPRISKYAPVGPLKRNKLEKGVLSPLYTVLRFNEGDLSFFEHYFETIYWYKYLRSVANYGARHDRMNITNDNFIKLPIPFPTLAEQKKIAHFFSTIDQKINQLQEKKNALEAYKKGVMQKIFAVGEKSITNKSITNYELKNNELDTAKTRNSSFVIPNYIRFKDDNGDEFPDWEVKKLGEVAKVYDGTHQTPKYQKQGIPFYSVEHVTANNFSKTKYITKEVFDKENKRVKLEKGDILMTRIGDIGTSKLIDWNVKASFYVSLALIKQSDLYNSKFLNQYISSTLFQKELWKRTIHVAFPKKINLGEISNCLVSLPCKAEQTKIANFLSKIDEKIENVNQQIAKTKEWKKGLLQKMFVN